MNTRHEDEAQYHALLHWCSDKAESRRRTDKPFWRDFRPAFLLLVLGMLCFWAAFARAAESCPWDADCITWPLPTKYETGAALDPARIDSYRLETATAVSGPWTTVATIKAPTRAYTRQPVSGSNYYRLFTILVSGVTSDPSVVSNQTTTVEPKPEAPPTLQVVDNVGYQLNLGSHNKISLSRVASVSLGKECLETMSVTDPYRTAYILKDRLWAVMDPNPKKPGEFYTRPNQVWAKCERRA